MLCYSTTVRQEAERISMNHKFYFNLLTMDTLGRCFRREKTRLPLYQRRTIRVRAAFAHVTLTR